MMPQSPDPESFGFMVADLSRLIRAEMDRRIAATGLGLTPGEGRTLAHAARAGEVRQIDLADRMGVEPMTLSAYLDRLEGRGLVKRSPDPTDRRAKLVRLTPAAAAVLEKVRQAGTAMRADISRDMDPMLWEQLNAGLRQAREALIAMRASQANESDAA